MRHRFREFGVRHQPSGSRRLALEHLEGRTVFSGTPTTECFEAPVPGMGPAEHVPWAMSPPHEQNRPPGFGPVSHVPPYDPSTTFTLHSRPSATRKIYLDFNGHTTRGTSWNTSYNRGRDIVSPVFNFEGTAATFSAAEHETIQGVWQRVAEDFSPFDVDVTTQDPGQNGLTHTGGPDKSWGVRIVVAADDDLFFDDLKFRIGGIANLPGFKNKIDLPSFVFAANLSYDQKFITEAVSHEIGHTLGLGHDGTKSMEYYPGHAGNGTPGWSPLMGTGYSFPLTQWSKGEYGGATNKQDDLAIITDTTNNFGYRPDDAGNTPLTATAAKRVNTDVTFAGVIERTTDVDVLAFQSGAGPVSFDINPWVNSPNLDIRATLMDVGGRAIAVSDPPDVLNARLTANVPVSGTYFLSVEGTGVGNLTTFGYSDYASLGQYTITGTAAPFVVEDAPVVTGLTVTESAAGLLTGARLTSNVPINPKTLLANNVKVTGPNGAAVTLLTVKVDPNDLTAAEFTFTPQRLTGQGGVRIALSAEVQSRASINLDTDRDNLPGETQEDYFASAVFKFNSAPPTPVPIGDNTTTDFPLIVDRDFNIRDLNVRANLRHPAVGELELQLVAPDDTTVIRLFNHRGLLGDHLTDTLFDEQAVKTLGPPAAAPYKGVFKPDFDVNTLATLNNTSSLGTWKLRVIDNATGIAGTLRSWGLTFTTDDARTPVQVVAVTPANEAASAFAKFYRYFTVEFDRPMNPSTVTSADFKLLNSKNAPVGILSVKPVPGSQTTFLATTAPVTRAGTYTIKIGPNVADTQGNSLDENDNGHFLETADTRLLTEIVERNVYQSAPRPAVIPDGKISLTSSIAIRDAIAIDRIAVAVNLEHAHLADLRLTLISPVGEVFTLANAGRLTGANMTNTTFTDEAAVPISAGTAPYSGDFLPEEALTTVNAKGTWKLKIEDVNPTGGLAGKLLSWRIYVKPW